MAVKKVAKKVKESQEVGARRDLLRELFNDFHSSRKEIYKVNFFRGIAFGFGSVIGATVLIFALIWFLNLFVNIPGGVGEFVQAVINAMNSRTR